MILFYAQHLLGAGHLRRIAAIAAETAAHGYPTAVVSGGAPVAEIAFGSAEVLQLPVLKSVDTRFAELVDAGGRSVDDAWKRRRAAQLLEFVASRRPRTIVVETFPFGRRKLGFELVALLAHVRELAARPATAHPRTADGVAGPRPGRHRGTVIAGCTGRRDRPCRGRRATRPGRISL